MRADEYLVEEIVKLKSENDTLKETNSALDKKIVELEAFINHKNTENDDNVNTEIYSFTDTIGKLYWILHQASVYDIYGALKDKKLTVTYLKECLEDDEKLKADKTSFSSWSNQKGFFQIDTLYYNHILRMLDQVLYLVVHRNYDGYLACSAYNTDRDKCNTSFDDLMVIAMNITKQNIKDAILRYNTELEVQEKPVILTSEGIQGEEIKN